MKSSTVDSSRTFINRYKPFTYKIIGFLIFIALSTVIFTGIMTDKAEIDHMAPSTHGNAMNFNWNIETISKTTSRYRISSQTSVDDQYGSTKAFLTYDDVFSLLAQDNYFFSSSFIDHLVNFHSKSYFFECIPVTKDTFKTKEFEFVLISAPGLDEVVADVDSFDSHFSSCKGNRIVSFTNLGNDATLVAPCPQAGSNENDFAHLGRFIRSQTRDLTHELWKNVAKSLFSVISDDSRPGDMKLWLSTSGLGVYWLHVRLDQRPKYYNYEPYKV